MQKPEAQAREKIVQHLQRSQREAVRRRREARRVDARERVDQSAQLDRVSRVCISTIQRLYSMLSDFAFIFLKMFSARRDQHEQTGNAVCAWHRTLYRVEDGACRVATTSIGKPRGREREANES